jgi:alcohol dehydrogenase
VVRFNAQQPEAREGYRELAVLVGLAEPDESHNAAADALAARLTTLLMASGLPTSLSECGVAAADLPVLAEEAASQWTAQFNPRPFTVDDFRGLYGNALRDSRYGG